jgi:hypothetical protein
MTLVSGCRGSVFVVGSAQTPPKARHETKAAAGGHLEIKGTVINSVDGNPVAHCHLTANLSGSAAGRPGMGSGPGMADGAFRGGNSLPYRTMASIAMCRADS